MGQLAGRVSALLPQPGGFEGLLPGAVKSQPDHPSSLKLPDRGSLSVHDNAAAPAPALDLRGYDDPVASLDAPVRRSRIAQPVAGLARSAPCQRRAAAAPSAAQPRQRNASAHGGSEEPPSPDPVAVRAGVSSWRSSARTLSFRPLIAASEIPSASIDVMWIVVYTTVYIL